MLIVMMIIHLQIAMSAKVSTIAVRFVGTRQEAITVPADQGII